MEDETGPGAFRPGDLTLSKLRFYSMGIVAENKKLGSMEVEVTPTEELTMLDGEVTTHQEDYKASASDTLGKNYQSSVTSQATVTASWLRFGDPNRMTSPDVRRGEAVMIYQFGDSNKYYWMTIKQDAKLRRLETVIWAISGSAVEGTAMDAANTYYLELSSHRGLAHFHTSNANGEFCAWDCQFDGKNGCFTLTDSTGNYFQLDAQNRRFEWSNIDGSHIDMNRKELTMTIPDQVTINTKHTQVNSPTITLNGDVNITGDTLMEKNTTTTLNTTVNGGLGVTQINGTGGSGKNKLKGGLIIETEGLVIEQGGLEVTGEATFHNNAKMDMDLLVTGYASLSGGYG